MSRRWRSIGWVGILTAAVVAVCIAALAGGGVERSNAERALDLADQFACPTCSGQSVANSDSTAAVAIRNDIRKRVDQGQTDKQITDFLVGSFSESISLKPRSTGVVGLVWITPVVAFITAAGGLAVVFRRWRHEARAGAASESDRALVAAARRGVAGDGVETGGA